MTVPDVAQKLGVSNARVRLLCAQGRFPCAEKIGRDWIIPESALETYTPLPRGRKTKKQRAAEEKELFLREAGFI